MLVVYVVAVLAATLTPDLPDVTGFRMPPWFDKVVHFGLIGGFAGLAHWVAWPRRMWIGVIAASWLLAGFIELAQGPIPSRSPELGDWIAGAAGALAGSAVFHIVMARSATDSAT